MINKNYIQIGALIYLLMNFLPLIPSGSFFSDFNITLFMMNFSLLYAVNSKTNIFEKINQKGAISSIVEYCIDIARVDGA